jgi:hypothetical protein
MIRRTATPLVMTSRWHKVSAVKSIDFGRFIPFFRRLGF